MGEFLCRITDCFICAVSVWMYFKSVVFLLIVLFVSRLVQSCALERREINLVVLVVK